MHWKNEGPVDRITRFLAAEATFLAGFFWLWGAWQIAAYVLATVLAVTAVTGICLIYRLLGITTLSLAGTVKRRIVVSVLSLLAVALPVAGSYYSNFFSKKIFLEDFGKVNNYYKQTLFFTGQNKRDEAKQNYAQLVAAYPAFQQKYSAYRPFAIRDDRNLTADLQTVWVLVESQRDAVGSGDLTASHKELEKVRPVFQDILKRNRFSPLSVALVDFHDSMEVMLDAAAKKDAVGVMGAYGDADGKLQAVEAELNDDSVKQIRLQLDGLLDMAKSGNSDGLSDKGADLKSSFVKVYLKRG